MKIKELVLVLEFDKKRPKSEELLELGLELYSLLKSMYCVQLFEIAGFRML